jgi:hypothetical protein
VCDLETSRIGAPYIYIYDISTLKVKAKGSRYSIVCMGLNVRGTLFGFPAKEKKLSLLKFFRAPVGLNQHPVEYIP